MKTVRKGGRGNTVRFAQECLRQKGWRVALDGIFGERTETAVEQFQAAQGLEADGIVGPLTWAALTAQPARPSPESVLASERQALLDQLVTRGIPDTPGYDACVEAISWLGVREEPDGSNTGPKLRELVDGYWEHWGVKSRKDSPPWCAIGATQWVRRGAYGPAVAWRDTVFGRWFGGVAQLEAWAKEKGVWHPRTDDTLDVPGGAIWTMGRGGSGSDPSRAVEAGHCGLALWHDDGRVLTTFEGNVGNAAAQRERVASKLRGYIDWAKLVKGATRG